LLGAPENIQLQIGPTDHGYSQENREAMYRFFNRVTGISSAQTEPALINEKDETLWCSPRGQVSDLNSRTVFSFTRETSQNLRNTRGQPAGEALRRSVRDVLELPGQTGELEYRILRSAGSRKYPARSYCAYAVETEPGVHALVTLLSNESLTSRPPRGKLRAVLYLSHQSADAELRDEPLIKELLKAEPDAAFYACDLRGIGDSQPDTCGVNQFLKPYGSDFFYAAHGLMLDRSYLGQRTFDALRVIDWLTEAGHQEIHLAGQGWGALPATFAALLSQRVNQVTLKHAPTSFGEIAETEDYQWPLALLPPGVLKRFDLPDCYRELAAKKLRQIEPWSARDGKA
jgi:pimeloyl-ACP methyl ester carboxylesterase